MPVIAEEVDGKKRKWSEMLYQLSLRKNCGYAVICNGIEKIALSTKLHVRS